MIEVALIRLLCLVVAYNAGMRLWEMSPRTAHAIRVAYVAQCAGALGAVCGIDEGLLLMLSGVAVRPLIDRRIMR